MHKLVKIARLLTVNSMVCAFSQVRSGIAFVEYARWQKEQVSISRMKHIEYMMSEAFSNLIGDCIFMQPSKTFLLHGTRPFQSGFEPSMKHKSQFYSFFSFLSYTL